MQLDSKCLFLVLPPVVVRCNLFFEPVNFRDTHKQYRPTKARDFEGEGGPETKAAAYAEANPGNDDVKTNVRQQHEPRGDPVPAKNIGKAHSALD